MLSLLRPTANKAGRPAPQLRLTTLTCHSACRSIQEFMTGDPPSGSGGRGYVDGASPDVTGPFGVDIVMADRGPARPQVDRRGNRDQDSQHYDHAAGSADSMGQGVSAGADHGRG